MNLNYNPLNVHDSFRKEGRCFKWVQTSLWNCKQISFSTYNCSTGCSTLSETSTGINYVNIIFIDKEARFHKFVCWKCSCSPVCFFVKSIELRTEMFNVFIFAWIKTGTLLILGTLIFSGTCYYYAFTEERWIRKYTPYGGFLLIFGWLSMAL